MTDPVTLRARELYANSFTPSHAHRDHILRGDWDRAPNMKPHLEQAKREAEQPV